MDQSGCNVSVAGEAWTEAGSRVGETGLDDTGVLEADNKPGELGLCAYKKGGASVEGAGYAEESDGVGPAALTAADGVADAVAADDTVGEEITCCEMSARGAADRLDT